MLNPAKELAGYFMGNMIDTLALQLIITDVLHAIFQKHTEKEVRIQLKIPRDILIPQANYEDHIRRAADDLIHLLGHKQNLLLPQASQSDKSVLLNIAKLLHRNTILHWII